MGNREWHKYVACSIVGAWWLTPPLRQLIQEATHRLISSKYSEAGTVLAEIAENEAMLDDLILLDGATNDRVQGERQGLIGIGPHELVFGIPGARIVNGAFAHASEDGGRFNDHTRSKFGMPHLNLILLSQKWLITRRSSSQI